MEVFVVDKITEADFGSEETNREEPMALLKLVPNDSSSACAEGKEYRPKYVEVPESVLAKQGIVEGKKVCFIEDGSILRYVRVVAAVICNLSSREPRVFATARGYGDHKGWWEFPGGKIEPGETPQEALVREINEELSVSIKVGDLIKTIEYDYPEFHLSMDCFRAEIEEGTIELKEAEEARWLTPNEFDSVRWLPADRELIENLKNSI